jgi:hypothetical protein
MCAHATYGLDGLSMGLADLSRGAEILPFRSLRTHSFRGSIRRLILADPQGIEPAVALARDLVVEAPSTDYASLLQRASSAA